MTLLFALVKPAVDETPMEASLRILDHVKGIMGDIYQAYIGEVMPGAPSKKKS